MPLRKHAFLRIVVLVMLALVGAYLQQSGAPTAAGAPPDLPFRAYIPGIAADPARAAGADPGPPDMRSPEDLTRALVDSTDVPAAVSLTQIILARGGVATVSDAGVHMAAGAPAGSMTVTVDESAKLAIEARRRANAGTLTAAELGQMLSDFGWRFPEGSDPEIQAIRLLAGWITAAHAAPSDPLSFTPLFLEAMARLQDQPVSLTSVGTDPGSLRLTALELELFGAAFDRGLTRSQVNIEAQQSASSRPCSFIKDATGKIGLASQLSPRLGAQLNDIGVAEVFGHALDAGLQGAGMSEANAGDLGNALAAVGAVMRVWKLLELYSSGNVLVIPPSPTSFHRPIDVDQDLPFQASAGVSDKDWSDYQAKMGSMGEKARGLVRDCLNSVGLPSRPDLGDVAEGAENWRVEGELVEGQHLANFSAKNTWHDPNGRPLPGAGRNEMPLARNSDHTATASVMVTFTSHTREEHDKGGPIATSPVTVRAKLRTDEPPSLSTFVNACKGAIGIVDSLVELAAGWFQALVTPRSYATVVVAYEDVPEYVDFDALLIMRPPNTSPEYFHAYAHHVPVWVNQPGKVGEGVLHIETDSAWWELLPNCTLAITAKEGIFKVLAATDADAGFRMWIDPGDASIQPTMTCRDPRGGPTIVIPLPPRGLSAWWQDTHAYGPLPPGGYELTGWRKLSPALWRWHDTRSWAVQGGSLSIESELNFHDPAGLFNP